MENKTRTKSAVCLFAEASDADALPLHTRHLLREIAQSGYRLCVALSGREAIGKARDGVEELGIAFYPRANAGLDFGAWQHLIRQGCVGDATEVLLANDSVFGPFRPLRPLVEAMRARRELDAWGMVMSQAITPHLQSWFVSMSREAFEAPAIRRVFAQPFCDMTKPEIVLHGELGLGLAMQAAGLRIGASWTGRRGIARALAINPMHTDWLAVLRSGRAPFIKTELLRDNPSAIASAAHWRDHLPHASVFDPAWIVAYLARNPRRIGAPVATWRARLVQAIASEDRLGALAALARAPFSRLAARPANRRSPSRTRP